MRVFISHGTGPVLESMGERVQIALEQRLDDGKIVSSSSTLEVASEAGGRWDQVVVLIDSGWLAAHANLGDDPVRTTIERALELGIPMIPVLLDNTVIDAATLLPESLGRLRTLQHYRLRSRDEFRASLGPLLDGLEKQARRRGGTSMWVLLFSAIAVAVAAAIGLAIWVSGMGDGEAIQPLDPGSDVVATSEPTSDGAPAGVPTPGPTPSIMPTGRKSPKPNGRAPAAPDAGSAAAAAPLTDETCRKSSLCMQSGRCSAKDGRCERLTDDDCRRSEECTVRGLCKLHAGRCVTNSHQTCRESQYCTTHAFCTAKDGACQRLSSEDCRRSAGCLRSGLCTFQAGACVAGSNAECEASERCSSEGKCVAYERECITAEAKASRIQAKQKLE